MSLDKSSGIGWETFHNRRATKAQTVRFTTDGKLLMSKDVDEYLGKDRVELMINRHSKEIGIRSCKNESIGGYKVQRPVRSNWANITVKAFLLHYGVSLSASTDINVSLSDGIVSFSYESNK